MADRSEQTQMLVNRIRKNAKAWRRVKDSRDVTCYRLYDRDIPEIPVAVDRYEDHVLVTQYEARHKAHTEEAGWFDAMCVAVAEELGVDAARLHRSRRERQAGASQYERSGTSGQRIEVREGGLSFWVNLDDYLDTGLFLDHRVTRSMVRDEAAGARFLNLFCYTGSFTVYAAAGGARSTTSVDMSNTYLRWAEDNLARLGDAVARGDHRFVRADVLAWLDDPARAKETYDLAVLDPPTFSNSKKMARELDTVRDHAALIRKTLGLLRVGGVLYFSSNARKLTLDADAIGDADVEDISDKTVPPDFRNRRIHQCWRIVKR